MTKKGYRSKAKLISEIVNRQGEILESKIITHALLDFLVPLSGSDGKIIDINEDGTVTIKFSVPIQAYLEFLTRKKLMMILDSLNDID